MSEKAIILYQIAYFKPAYETSEINIFNNTGADLFLAYDLSHYQGI
jgi:hypothetical protein